MDNFTLRQLRYFEALAHHGHFGRAADACAISQPALSVQIKELEESLGVTLFERAARNIRLTGFGEDFAKRARAILQSVDELRDLARASRETFSGKLRLGVIPTIAPYLLPTLLRDLGKAHPALDIHVRETLTPRLIEELADGRLDAAIVALPINIPSFTEVPLFAEGFFLVRQKRDAKLPVPTVDELHKERLLMLEEGHCFRDQAMAFCNMQSLAPREGLDGSSLSTLVQMVGAGLGMTLIPEMAVPVETRSAKVAVEALGKGELSRTVGMIWRTSTPLAGQFESIAEIVKAAAR
ncbi:MAG: LysR family transcriptional regulator [Silicimonas sp.]|nr:LysR family transcriptional regulator [Silicimonas sp.]